MNLTSTFGILAVLVLMAAMVESACETKGFGPCLEKGQRSTLHNKFTGSNDYCFSYGGKQVSMGRVFMVFFQEVNCCSGKHNIVWTV